MRQYLISKRKRRHGPYKLEELIHKGITASTLVWFAGSNGWKPAGNIEELKSFLPAVEPHFFKREKHPPEIAIVNNSEEDISYWLLKTFSLLLLIIFLGQFMKVLEP